MLLISREFVHLQSYEIKGTTGEVPLAQLGCCVLIRFSDPSGLCCRRIKNILATR